MRRVGFRLPVFQRFRFVILVALLDFRDFLGFRMFCFVG